MSGSTKEYQPPPVRWADAARALIAHLAEPAALVDESERVLLANEALAHVLEAPAAGLEGARWGPLLGEAPVPSRCPLTRADGGRPTGQTGQTGQTGPTRCSCVAIHRENRWDWLTVEDEPIGGAVLRRVTHCRTGEADAPAPAYVELSFRIAAGPAFGRLEGTITTRPPVCSLELPGAGADLRCHEAIFARPAPCPGCPSRTLDKTGAPSAVGVVRGTGARDTCALETAARREDGSIDVTVRLLTDDVLGELFHARADVMATRAGLSEREREVFDLILLGRTAVETSGVLGISPRTVKFHQANVMAKLGADSRADLLRLML